VDDLRGDSTVSSNKTGNPLLNGLPLLGDLPDLDGASVLVRVDFNVPLRPCEGEPSVVTDDFRIRAALPTLEYLLAQGATVTACTHLGRPDGAPDVRYDLGPVREELARLAPQVELLENLRFDPGEEANDPAFVEKLINSHDAYVNDAFGVSHRSHASVVGPPSRLPSAAGFLLQLEIEALGGLLGSPARPFVAVVGGAKVADKLGVLKALLHRVDVLIVGGGMAFTFLAAAGHSVGGSLIDPDRIDECAALLASGKTILLPSDIVALEPGASFGCGCIDGEVTVTGSDLPDGWCGLDIGPVTVDTYAEAIATAGTVLWNGPMGVFEDERFAAGTRTVAEAVAACPGFTVVGGGDSARALDELGMGDAVDFLSTGGGASLELIEHGDLPGLAALRAGPNAPGEPTKRRPSRGGASLTRHA
jgi:phosphoglycerate kinase